MSASFSARSIFQWLGQDRRSDTHLYEERITLWQAEDADQALRLAEAEAVRYATDQNCIFLRFIQTYELPSNVSANGIEIFSLLRESKLDPGEYVDQFFDTGNERQRSA